MKEEKYTLTFRGLLGTQFMDDRIVQQVLDTLELYMRRFDYNAIILEKDGLNFHKVTKK